MCPEWVQACAVCREARGAMSRQLPVCGGPEVHQLSLAPASGAWSSGGACQLWSPCLGCSGPSERDALRLPVSAALAQGADRAGGWVVLLDLCT